MTKYDILLDWDGVVGDVRRANELDLKWVMALIMGLPKRARTRLMAARDPMLYSVETHLIWLFEAAGQMGYPPKCSYEEALSDWKVGYPLADEETPNINSAGKALTLLRDWAGIGKIILVTNREAESLLAHDVDVLALHGIVTPECPGCEKKPSPSMLEYACKIYDCDPARTYYVGDGPVDVQSARAAGIKPRIVRTGWPGVEGFYDQCLGQGVEVHDDILAFARSICAA